MNVQESPIEINPIRKDILMMNIDFGLLKEQDR